MAIKTITLEEFESYNVKRYLTPIATEEYWFANDEANLLGTVLHDKVDNDWAYVILALNEEGEYRAEEVEASIDDEDEVLRKIHLKMIEIARIGKIESELYKSTLFDSKSLIIVNDMNEEIKKFFKKYPERLYELNPRKFEELIASIMKDLGFDVELTKATRDGGRDIIASVRNAVSNFIAYIECKRYAPDNKIDVGIVRHVMGVHYLKKPSKSIIVTTSFFTKDAQEEARLAENQLDLKDYNDIQRWLDEY